MSAAHSHETSGCFRLPACNGLLHSTLFPKDPEHATCSSGLQAELLLSALMMVLNLLQCHVSPGADLGLC